MNILVGKSKTGKSRYIYESIEEDIKCGKEVILFVPSQTRALAEENYMSFLNKNGIIGVNITTISAYIEDSIKSNNLHLEDKYISKLDKKIILSKVISENKESLKVFKNISSKDGFLDILNIYIDIFRKENIDPNKILSLNIKDKVIELKLKEVIFIYQKYIEKIKEKYIDSIDEIDIFVKNMLEKKVNLRNTNIYFDGYNNFNASEYKIIESLIKSGANITFSLTTDITCKEDIYSENTQSIFEISNDTYLKLLSLSNRLGCSVENKILYNNYSKSKESLKYIADNIFSSNSEKMYKKEFKNDISLNLTTNLNTEIESIAKEISKGIRSGYSYNDFCIYTTSIDSYELVIKRIFYEYNIPVYIDKKHNISDSKIISYFSNLLKMASFGLDFNILLDTIKLNLNDIVIEDVYEFENYIREFNINKYAVNKDLYLNNESSNDKIYDLERINKTRKDILEIFEQIAILNKNDITSKEAIKELYDHLVKCNVIKNYLDSFKIEKTENDILNITKENLKDQVLDNLADVLNSISKIYGNSKIKIKDFLEIFSSIVKDISVKSIPPTMDIVSVVDINSSKIGMKKNVFFVGVSENNFPKKIDADLLFSDFELEKLQEDEIKFKETSLSKNNMQLYNIYEAINNTEEKLNIYVPASDTQGKSQRPSNLITLLKQVIDIKLNGDISETFNEDFDIYDIYSKDMLFDKIISDFQNDNLSDENLEQRLAAYEYIVQDERYKKITQFRKNDDNLDKETIDLLYENKLNSSVTKLELFKKCPFSYYMKYCLKINPRKEFEISSLDIGSFMHEVLEAFSMYIYKQNIHWQAILNEGITLNKEYEKILFQIIHEKLDSNLKKQKESVKYVILKQKLVNTMKKVIVVIARGFNQSEFVPFGYEVEFKEGKKFVPIQLKLDENRYMNLIGKIDRIDILKNEENTYARVVDYKSSSKDLKLDDIKEGLSLQLITYMTSFMENMEREGENIIPSGMLYFNLSDKLLNLSEYTDNKDKIESECLKALRMKGIFLKDAKILDKMDSKFASTDGKFIDVSAASISKNSNKVLDQKEFENLCIEAKNILKNIGQEIISGVVKIKPNKKADHCKYCEYSSVCRKDICV